MTIRDARAAALRHGFDEDDPRHHGVPGKMPGEKEIGPGEPPVPHDFLRVRLLDPIHEKEWIPVGKERLDVGHARRLPRSGAN